MNALQLTQDREKIAAFTVALMGVPQPEMTTERGKRVLFRMIADLMELQIRAREAMDEPENNSQGTFQMV